MTAPAALVDLVARIGRSGADALIGSWLEHAERDGLHVDEGLLDAADALLDAAQAQAAP